MLAVGLFPTAIPVTVAGIKFTVLPVPAAAWLHAIVTDPFAGILPGLLGDADKAVFLMAMAEEAITDEDIRDATREVICEASGRARWWEAVRLAGASDSKDGRLFGSLLLRGLDPHRVTFAGWCAATYALLAENRDEKSMTKLDFQLMDPPGDIDAADDMFADWDTPAPW